MNAADNQAQNLNSNPHNPNLTNLSSNKFERDYDKEPLIIKSYERFISTNLELCSYLSSFMIAVYVYCRFDENISNDIGLDEILMFVLFLFSYFLLSYYYCVIRHRYEIHFMNSSVNFYKDGELMRVSSNEDLEEIIEKPFWRGSSKLASSDKIFWLAMFILWTISYGWYFILFLSMSRLLNIFFKLSFYIFLNGKLKYFRVFPIIIIDKPLYPNYFISSGAYIFAGKYYYVYIFNEDIYSEIRSYFLDRKNIDIDDIKKSYFI